VHGFNLYRVPYPADLAQHYLLKANISAIRRVRKTDNNRIARVCGATIVSRTDELQESDVGTGCGLFEIRKYGDEYVCSTVAITVTHLFANTWGLDRALCGHSNVPAYVCTAVHWRPCMGVDKRSDTHLSMLHVSEMPTSTMFELDRVHGFFSVCVPLSVCVAAQVLRLP
jgi:hypothetical protein